VTIRNWLASDHARQRLQHRALAAMTAAIAFAVTPSTAAAASTPAPAPASTVWLCRPGLAHNPCATNLTATVVSANGSRSVQHATPASNPPIGCFYVYPTVSAQATTNADLTIDAEETAIAENQASRFSSACRVFAPMYRQVTLHAINTGTAIQAGAAAVAYTSLLASWQDYLAHDNHGRGVVFIGHSQGAALLIALLRREIDPNPTLRRRVVSALLLGGNVTVAAGRDVGGDFQNLPACHATNQTGCVVAYSSFDHTPPADSLFGRVGQGVSTLAPGSTSGALQVLCVNPASLTGGSGDLEPYFSTKPFPGPLGQYDHPQATLPTPWVTFPKLYTSQREQSGGATWLQINAIGGSGDARPRITDALGPTWGLHLGDVNLALGNLVSLVQRQGAAYHR
jgi:hypothetical protein